MSTLLNLLLSLLWILPLWMIIYYIVSIAINDCIVIIMAQP